ncbi:hypothetical protein MTO96_037117 [Rhipicephalus appendiculatus]
MKLEADTQYLLELDLSFVEDSTCFFFGPLFDALASNTMVRALKFRPLYRHCHVGDALRRALIANRSIQSLQLDLEFSLFESPPDYRFMQRPPRQCNGGRAAPVSE